MQRVLGKRALITVTVLRLAEEGAEMLATDVNDTALAELTGVKGVTTQVMNVLGCGRDHGGGGRGGLTSSSTAPAWFMRVTSSPRPRTSGISLSISIAKRCIG